MLISLYVKDFAIVGKAEIAFGAGLTVVTGETGAGKSLLVDALLLLTGGRADSGCVRHGCERAELVAEFDLTDAPQAKTWLSEEALDDDGQCQLRRVIRTEGSSKCYINGRPVTLGQLSALGERLVEIHGQHEHQALLERTSQLALLDAYGNHPQLLAHVGDLAKRWRSIDEDIQRLMNGADEAERIAYLQHQLAELEQHALTPAQLDALTADHKRFTNAGQLIQGTAGAIEMLDGESEWALLRQLARAQTELTRLAEIDPRLQPAQELIDAAHIQLTEAADSLTRYQNTIDLDSEQLQRIETELGKLHELARKHRVPMADLKARAIALQEELQALQSAAVTLVKLRKEREAIATDYTISAAQLSSARTLAAQQLSTKVTALIGELGMGGGQFEIRLDPQSGTDPDALGNERAEFLVTANAGHPLKALRKVASGGELSRISLAIEVAAFGLDDVSTMVFDEVDSGIGGAIAEVVGQKLRRLGSKRQVLCVTHLAQVAAQGHQHLLVAKSTNTGNTQTSILALNQKSRSEELARMLGGIDITKTTLAHARQMLEGAQARN